MSVNESMIMLTTKFNSKCLTHVHEIKIEYFIATSLEKIK